MNLFDRITLEDKDKILRTLEATTFHFLEGVKVFNQDQGNTLGLIEEGIVQIIRNDYNGDRIIIEELKKGAVFGTRLSSITSDDFDVVSISPCKITFFEFSRIFSNEVKTCNGYVELQENLIQIMSLVIESRNERIQVLSKKTIRERLLEYFSMTEKKQKTKNIVLPFNYTELADYLAINRSAMHREIKALQDEHVIAIRKKVITLLFEKDYL